MAEAPPSLPGVLSRPDAQIIVDALNKRLWEVEEGKGLKAGVVTDEKLAKPVIVGEVTSAGGVGNGSGFTSVKAGTGIYEVTLNTELTTVGIMNATAVGAFLIPGVVANAKKIFQVQFKDGAGVLTNTAFNFHIKAI